ncbi:CoA transferase [bacterium]|nr:MAG: CoA transferase [bacterium]
MTSALSGIRILTIAANVPGPVAAARLRDLGARVAKIEPPSGDLLAYAAPRWYAELHENIEVLRLDLKHEAERATLHVRLAESDVLVTSSRPAALARLGLAWSDLHALYPRLVQVAIVGRASPHADDAGHDLTYQAAAGLLTPPQMPRALLADLAGAERAVSAVLALLFARERHGEANYAEVSLEEGARAFAAPLRAGLTTPGGVLGGGSPHYACYRASDGWVALGNVEAHFQQRLARELELDGAVDRKRLAALFLTRSATEWEAWGAQRGLPIVAVATPW